MMVQQEEGLTATVCDLVWAEEMELAFWLLQRLNMRTVSALGYSEYRVLQEKEKVEGAEGVEVKNPLTVNYPGHCHLNTTTVLALGYSENTVVQEKEKVEGVEGVEVQNPLTVNYPGHHHLAASPLVIKISTLVTYYTLKYI